MCLPSCLGLPPFSLFLISSFGNLRTTSAYLYISISQYHSISVSQYLNISISQYLNISVSKYLTISISQYLNISMTQYPNTSISQYLNIFYVLADAGKIQLSEINPRIKAKTFTIFVCFCQAASN